jgi:hypothetical protein
MLLIASHPAAAQSINDRADNVLANAAIGAATGGLRAVMQRKPYDRHCCAVPPGAVC